MGKLNSYNNFSISKEHTQRINFSSWITDCDFHHPPLLNYFLSSDPSICSTVAFPPLGNSIYVIKGSDYLFRSDPLKAFSH